MTLRWGLIGCGDVARKRVAEAIGMAADSQLAAACRRDAKLLEEFCRDYGVPRSYRDAAELIADPEIDAVYIATPVNLHLEQTIASARAGKHVLVEKPMAMNTDECRAMISACREGGVQLGVAYYRRFYPVIERMRQLISSGEIGTVLSVSVVTGTPIEDQPQFDGRWRLDPAQSGGGALMDIGSHRLNLLRAMFGPVGGVRAFSDTLGASYSADNCTHVLVRFESGIHGSVACYFGIPTDPDSFVIQGTLGQLSCAPLNAGTLHIDSPQGRRTEQHPPVANFNLPQIEDFVRAVANRESPRVDGPEGLETNLIMERAYQDANVVS